MNTYAYGFPRIGFGREFKKATEGYWKGRVTPEGLHEATMGLQKEMISQYEAHVDGHPLAEMTGYDHMLDTALMCGVYNVSSGDEYYDLCRGKNALEMTKWFNTNYHYLVSDFTGKNPEDLALNQMKIATHRKVFGDGTFYLIGPFTLLKLSKGIADSDIDAFTDAVVDIYVEAIKDLKAVHIDEPAFVLNLSPAEIARIERIYQKLGAQTSVNVFTYYDAVDFLDVLTGLPIDGIGLDFVHGPENLNHIVEHGFPADKTLYAGLIDGRNVWRSDPAKVHGVLRSLDKHVTNLVLTNAAPLFHLPLTLEGEDLQPELMARLSFAVEKLGEIESIAASYGSVADSTSEIDSWTYGRNTSVSRRVATLTDADFSRPESYAERKPAQDAALSLPLLATTTIGSFPQTRDVRKARADFNAGQIREEAYRTFVEEKIKDAVDRQERLNLDVLVHGEFERSDMVEFFAEKLDGVATTKNGWIISYGTRGYRPPIIFGDVSRPEPMTVREVAYAQSLTKKPVKGMLTGPVTIIAWSFTRDDIPVSEVAYQIGLALRDEIADYEKAGIGIVQVDEPAFRELAPNKRSKWDTYFEWAIKSFRLSTAGAKAVTQIHSHMCYSDFDQIIKQIAAMDFDVISIEATRSGGHVIAAFEEADFDRQIGLGVWDIHSPAVPQKGAIEGVVDRALQVIPATNFWINPDCGLKTRGWEESMESLGRMTEAATEIRKKHSSGGSGT